MRDLAESHPIIAFTPDGLNGMRDLLGVGISIATSTGNVQGSAGRLVGAVAVGLLRLQIGQTIAG